ncbi:MAG: erythromycin biosynthesis sensory transduction protein eryC1 [Blastocatellia bacterium]|nr:MAG: erythromycin biosynthesis sensory transduction protein eryC1 [Blastocatellia bacterium]
MPFTSLTPGEDRSAVREAIERVIARGWFVLGPEVERFETEFAAIAGASYAIGVGNGTDALMLILRALGIGAGDEVITTPLSAAYTALAITMAGARPVFADIDPDRFTIDPARLEVVVGPRTGAIMPVHLYGQAADMEAISHFAARHNLVIVEDCCQAHLATAAGRPVGTIGVAGAFSFYPTKNLAALGDGGAIVTNDRMLADRIRRLRNGGQIDRDRHQEPGVNSRLDEMQAAILVARLPFLRRWTERRRELAARYRAELAGAEAIAAPIECDRGHVYHLFVVKTRERDRLQARLAATGIETLVHYRIPIPRQQAFATVGGAECPIAAAVCDRILSLPLHPRLTDHLAADVAAAVLKGVATCAH